MTDREQPDQQEQQKQQEQQSEEKPSRGYRIPGRDFAGTSFAADQEEQTRDHRGENDDFRVDDTPTVNDDRGGTPRDAP